MFRPTQLRVCVSVSVSMAVVGHTRTCWTFFPPQLTIPSVLSSGRSLSIAWLVSGSSPPPRLNIAQKEILRMELFLLFSDHGVSAPLCRHSASCESSSTHRKHSLMLLVLLLLVVSLAFLVHLFLVPQGAMAHPCSVRTVHKHGMRSLVAISTPIPPSRLLQRWRMGAPISKPRIWRRDPSPFPSRLTRS